MANVCEKNNEIDVTIYKKDVVNLVLEVQKTVRLRIIAILSVLWAIFGFLKPEMLHFTS